MKSLLLDCERLKYPYCGLGRFCHHLGLQAKGAGALAQDFKTTYLLPPQKKGAFGEGIKSLRAGPFQRFFPSLSPTFDIWHMTHQDSPYWPSSRGTKMLLTIHDLNFLQEKKSLKKQEQRLRKLQKKIDRSDMIVAISQFTQKCILDSLQLRGKEIRVIYNGVEKIPFEERNETFPFPHLKRPYFFSLGVVRAKKNFATLIGALKELPKYDLVIAGDDSGVYAKELKRRIEREGLSERIHLCGPITDGQRNQLYHACRAFLFPSLAEGFGFPVLEAMGCGKPVFISPFASLPEIAHKWGYVFEDFSPKSMAQSICVGLEHFDAHPEWAQDSRKWASRFSWQECMAQYRKAYLDLT